METVQPSSFLSSLFASLSPSHTLSTSLSSTPPTDTSSSLPSPPPLPQHNGSHQYQRRGRGSSTTHPIRVCPLLESYEVRAAIATEGVDLDLVDPAVSFSPLGLAIFRQSLSIVNILLDDEGAKPNLSCNGRYFNRRFLPTFHSSLCPHQR